MPRSIISMWKAKESIWSVLTCLGICLIVFAYLLGYRCYIVMSGSMEPQLPTGSLCLVDTRVEYETIGVGDVIVYAQHNGLVTHRVVAVTEDGLETKGDANDISDGIRVTRANFGGKTMGAIPGLGYVLYWLKQPLVQGIGGVAVITVWIWERWRHNGDREND